MADTPMVRILGFKTEYRKVIGKSELQAEDWVRFGPVHSIQTTVNNVRVSTLVPPENTSGDHDLETKIGIMKLLWSQIEPAYKAWKEGREIPLNGTPLSVWPGITEEQAAVLRPYNIRTVEDVSIIQDGAFNKIMLPNIRELRQQALNFLEARTANDVADRLTQKDEEIAAMKDMIAEMQENMAALTDAKKSGSVAAKGKFKAA